MEGLEAISLASNILQFIELGGKIIKASREIYQSATGTTKEFENLEETCKTISRLSAALAAPRSPRELSAAGSISKEDRPVKAEIELGRVALRCKEASDKLYKELEALRLHGPRGKGAVLRQSIKSLWARSNLKDLESNMESCRKDLMMCLTAITADQNLQMQPAGHGKKERGQSGHVKKEKQSALSRYYISLQIANFDIIPQHSETLDQLLQDIIHVNTQARLCLDDASGEEITPLIHSLSRVLEDSATADRHRWEAEHAIVKALMFEAMHARRESIPQSHAETFQWILQEGHPRSKFFEWLQTGEGIYWISGKPGSGKSTLMKFLGNSPLVQTTLERWAGADKKCVLVTSYFWLAGSPLQKSLEGLLRTILFEIFVHNPKLIPLAAPDRWERFMGARLKRPPTLTVGDPSHLLHVPEWTVSEMLTALRNLSILENADTRFCLFIDGLDEYHGDHRHLVQTMTEISKSPNFKMCVSSRPWNVFEDALGFDRDKKLYIHELTAGDIRRYAEDKFNENAHWKKSAATHDLYMKLIDEIIEKAQGVFLWVVLVVQSLNEGLSNGDSLYLLEKRLNELPSELEPFFRHILDSVPQRYHKHMALYFRVTLEAVKPVSLLHYSFLDEYLESDDGFMLLDSHASDLGDPDLHARHAMMKRRLAARCKGLLLADGRDGRGQVLYESDYERNREHSYWPQLWTAGFLHRTVHDFLTTDDMQQFLDDILDGCDVNMALLMTHILYSKVADLNPAAEELLGDAHLRQALYFAGRAGHQVSNSELAAACTDELVRVHSQYVDEETIVNITLRNNLCQYVKTKLDSHSHGYRDTTALLTSTLRAVREPLSLGGWDNILPMVELLLESGARPSLMTLEFYLDSLTMKVSSCGDEAFLQHQQAVLNLLLPTFKDINEEYRGVVWGPFFVHVSLINWTDSLIPRQSSQRLGGFGADALFTHGADPNASYEDTTIWMEVQDSLSNLIGIRQSKPSPGLEVTARFIEMMVNAGADIDSPGSLSVAEIREIFPFRAANRILYAIGNHRERRDLQSAVG